MKTSEELQGAHPDRANLATDLAAFRTRKAGFNTAQGAARGVFFAVQKALPLMNEGGSIILTGSGVRQKGVPVYATYGATKAALRSFARTWTADLSGKGIRANVISPGPVETPGHKTAIDR